MSTSKLDAVYRSILITKFFTKGWGKPENLRRLFEFRKVVSNREECFKLVERDYPVTITKEQNLSDCKLIEGYFTSPMERYLPGIVPEIVRKAHFQVMLPIHWPEKGVKPVCLHLAGTGDHYFWRRRNLMVKPLLKEAGIGGIILENPFYGLRKPTDQVRSSLHNVSDIFVMGGCLILEALVLFHWCERNGLGPLGVTGLSMGGHMASLAATNWPKPLVLVPCLSWSTASAVFLQGVMSQSINWDLLEHQYLSDGVYREELSKMVTIVDEAFLAGKKFARNYSQIAKPDDPNPANTNTNLDITYKESNCKLVVDVSKNLDGIPKSPNYEPKSELTVNIEILYAELKKLLEENKITKELYDKLVSNKKFALHPDDIEDLNKLTEERLKEVLMKCKMAFLKQEDEHNRLIHAQSQEPVAKTAGENIISAGDDVIKSSIDKITGGDAISSSDKILKSSSDQITGGDAISSSDKIIKSSSDQILNSSSDKIIKSSIEITIQPLKQAEKPIEKSPWNISELAADWINLPFLRAERKIDISKIHWRDREALQFMRGVMDECTHLSNFSVPFDTSLIIAVCARHDAYVPRDDVGTLEEIWPGAEVRYVDAGHVSAYILHQSMFRSCIREAFERSKKTWKDGEHIV